MESVALISAAARGDISTVQALLNRGVNTNVKDDHEVRPLMVSSAYNHIAVVKILLDKGADVNAMSIDGATALMLASEKGNVYVVQLLLAADADLNIKDIDGRTALDYATLNGHHRIIGLLNEATIATANKAVPECTKSVESETTTQTTSRGRFFARAILFLIILGVWSALAAAGDYFASHIFGEQRGFILTLVLGALSIGWLGIWLGLAFELIRNVKGSFTGKGR